MKFIADLHIHSRFSRATAKNLDFQNLYLAARLKGITVVGTGDFTHPAWFAEIQRDLEPAESGLFKLKDELEAACEKKLPFRKPGTVRFMLSGEISNIYKKGEKTRKLHHLVFLPDLESADRFNARLDNIGNIKSDGRPILGLDSRDLLEILLETSDAGFLVPAHIWTPWFSLFGSKSGFDAIRDCFEDLTPHIFAVETGLSSDPPMNWRVGDIDGLTLISNSDAHSPANLGREANLFNTDLSYRAIADALKTGDPARFLGTLEFFPEEGKYHQDGHRKCNVNLHPAEARKYRDICPVCGHPLTLGVLHRVEELATRPAGEKPAKTYPYYSIIPLAEILSEIAGCGPKSKKVDQLYTRAIRSLGPELDILQHMPIDRIAAGNIPLLDESVRRMREGRIHIAAGFDGEYGRITLFTPEERDRLMGRQSLFAADRVEKPAPVRPRQAPKAASTVVPPPAKDLSAMKTAEGQTAGASAAETKKHRISNAESQTIETRENASQIPADKPATRKSIKPMVAETASDFTGAAPNADIPSKNMLAEAETSDTVDILAGLNEAQVQAVTHDKGPLIIIAGPGTGKTRTLTCRIAWLIRHCRVKPENILAVTFTNKAAREMTERLEFLLGRSIDLPLAATFHALCLKILKENDIGGHFTVIDDDDQSALVADAVRAVRQQGFEIVLSADAVGERIAAAKQKILSPTDDLADIAAGMDPADLSAIYATYQRLLQIQHLVDFEDLIFRTVCLLENDADIRRHYRRRYPYIFVDEYQDLNHGQYRITRALAPEDGNIFVIGDPDQSIYGFRGASAAYFRQFASDYPSAARICLTRNYRSDETILAASHQVIRAHSLAPGADQLQSGIRNGVRVQIREAASEKSEAVLIGKIIEAQIGGTGFHFNDFNKGAGEPAGISDRAFSDFAVLFRTKAQCDVFAQVFSTAGIPFQIASRENAFARPAIKAWTALFKIIEGFGTYHDFARFNAAQKRRLSKKDLDALFTWGLEKRLPLSGLLAEARRTQADTLGPAGAIRLQEMIDRVDELAENTADLTVRDKLASLLEQPGCPRDMKPDDEPDAAAIDAVDHILGMAEAFGEQTENFIEAACLQRDPDLFDPRSQKVALMTLHAAKGLEFPVVFVAGCEDGFIPLAPRGARHTDTDEERRLFYVAMTRAKEALYFTFARKRNIYGTTETRAISPFVADIEKQLLQSKSQETRCVQKGPVQLSLFS
ncbi:MAG: DNA helicase [Desulfobacteraceae bacterium]|nr:MAG: DNA helicase [Desulfobacteraceae bacterium]